MCMCVCLDEERKTLDNIVWKSTKICVARFEALEAPETELNINGDIHEYYLNINRLLLRISGRGRSFF